MAGNDNRESSPDAPNHAVDIDALRAELAEAKRISRWLYNHVPWPVRHFLGDVSEWPYLLDEDAPADDTVPTPFRDAERDQAVLHAFALIQAAGQDPYDAEHIPGTLGLTSEEFDGTLRRLIHDGLVTGGRLPSRAFVETVTGQGMAIAGMLGAGGEPLPVIKTDLASFSGAGYGKLNIPKGVHLEAGQAIVVTDEEADVLEARVLDVAEGTAHIRVNWNGRRR
ncbi:hypothetical protein ACNKF0_09490 [Nocardioides sp. T5]|uniref:hypothetical protein n=1 Tax=Nocardioides sp. T5 TaxID=3400182 RepID=UPI003A8BBD67